MEHRHRGQQDGPEEHSGGPARGARRPGTGQTPPPDPPTGAATGATGGAAATGAARHAGPVGDAGSARANGWARDAGSTDAGSTNAGSANARSTDARSADAGSANATAAAQAARAAAPPGAATGTPRHGAPDQDAARPQVSIFTEMTELARRTGAVNLGQGIPELDSPTALLEDVARAVRAGENQYPPAYGLPALRQAVADHQKRRYGLEYAPDGEVLVTTGATEALAAALLGLTGPGDEVLTFDPAYDAYPAGARISGATLVRVPLVRDGEGFALDTDAVRAALTPRTRVLLLNSPHNPTGKVFTEAELGYLARLCREHDLIAVTDEVYEHLTYEGDHLPLAAQPGMRERTLTVSSAGKTFNVTGWKVGWVCGPGTLVSAVTSVKQFLTYASGTPYQGALARMVEQVEPWAAELRARLRTNRDLLHDGLSAAGLRPFRAEAGYFLQADVREWGYQDGFAFCRDLPESAGVVAIPTRAFQQDPDHTPWLVRFSFCRRPEALREATALLNAARPSGARPA